MKSMLRESVPPSATSQPGVDRLAFQGQDAEDAFVDVAQGLAGDETLQAFVAEGELAQGQ